MHKDFLVKTEYPVELDNTLQPLGAALIGGGGMKSGFAMQDGCYIMRTFTNADFIKFAIKSQGYGEVVRELPNGMGQPE